jgi:hypothetical protein
MTGAQAVTLPTPTSKRVVGVISVNGSGASPCTVTAGSGHILGKGVAASATSILLGAPGASVTLEADGTNWNIVAGEQDSGWRFPSGLNSWSSSAGPPSNNTIGYRLQGDRLKINGHLASGSNGTAAINVPAGYRPTFGQYWVLLEVSSANVGYVYLGTNGDLTPTMNVATSNGCFIAAEMPID